MLIRYCLYVPYELQTDSFLSKNVSVFAGDSISAHSQLTLEIHLLIYFHTRGRGSCRGFLTLLQLQLLFSCQIRFISTGLYLHSLYIYYFRPPNIALLESITYVIYSDYIYIRFISTFWTILISAREIGLLSGFDCMSAERTCFL